MAKIGLDFGHGSNTFPPDKGVNKNGKGYAEHDFNSKLGLKIKKLLENNGHKVILGQPAYSAEVGLTARTNLYNRENVDLVVSIHANAGAASADGRCAFYWHTSSSGKRLAELVVEEIKKKGYSTHGNGLHASQRGSWTNLHITRETSMPAVLIEHGFMTNNDDFELIFGSKQDQYTDDMAEADVKAIQRYLGDDYASADTSDVGKSSSKPKTSNKNDEEGVQWVGTDLKGKRVESIYKGSEGLNFYDSPRWNNPTGTFGYGAGWMIDNKYLVDGSPMYRVQNSSGDLYFITASPAYVEVVGGSGSSNGVDLDVDGKWGVECNKALQEALGMKTIDGTLSSQSQNDVTLALYGGVTWGSNGSPTVEALQRKIGATVDGLLGPGTIRALQDYLGTPVDGVLSRPSSMVVEELQRRLNAGTF